MSQFDHPTPATPPVTQSDSLEFTGRNTAPVTEPPTRLVFPFRLGLDYMERLVVVGLKGDPEFTAIEPQVFDDPQNGRGMRILRYRRDGRVDIYHDPGVRINCDHYTFGEGIADLQETPISPAHFEIGAEGLHLDIGFHDADGRQNVLRIIEGGPTRGFSMLAPVGGDIRAPRMLFLVLMQSIALLRRRGTEFSCRIGDRTLRLSGLPVPLYGYWVWFTRYSDKLGIATLNPPSTTPLVKTLPRGNGSGTLDKIVLSSEGDVLRLTAGKPGRGAEMSFSPPFPNLDTIPAKMRVEGSWSLSICGTEITGGTYSALRNGAVVDVDLRPTVPWHPGHLPLAMRGLVQFIPRFRTWPTTYMWSGHVELCTEPTMRGAWSRLPSGWRSARLSFASPQSVGAAVMDAPPRN